VPVEICASLREAVERARSGARPGDIVLLAPACSSFDMFRDYAHRGRAFKEEVQRLAEGRVSLERRSSPPEPDGDKGGAGRRSDG
jgi:UDP-N-acetylmuramoylalanine--D-glutamate ligase